MERDGRDVTRDRVCLIHLGEGSWTRNFSARTAALRCRRVMAQVLAIDPEFAGAYLALGMVHRAQGGMTEAFASFRKGAELAPGSPAFLAGIE